MSIPILNPTEPVLRESNPDSKDGGFIIEGFIDQPNSLIGSDGGDNIGLGNQNDVAYGGGGDDQILGFQGNDQLYGGDGNDAINAGKGNDIIDGGGGDDFIFGDEGNDQILGAEGSDILLGNQGNDNIIAGSGNDDVYGGKGNDTVDGGEGDDLLFGDLGDDVVSGGVGNDFIYGGLGQDSLIGGEGDDSFYGGKGQDTIIGGNGNDFLSGDKGNDSLIGGLGDDTFIFVFVGQPTSNNITELFGLDTLTDFTVAEDKIFLDADLFNAINTQIDGSLNSGELTLIANFDPNNSLVAGSANLVYDNVTGTLYYLDKQGQATPMIQMGANLNLNDNNFRLI
ncbi:calcium-binding protein [Planktothrix agardhii]|uniref:calcium-binding protein n=1 Tax=Planktothrix agardhii TaxID=1160 RepID=UPI0020A78281|nr:calcium-binding protein [Planktothrix agardhii]CAD5961554.1 Exotoxin PaxA [Planktothrix agardhii]